MNLLTMKDICKSFNGIQVLKKVQLTVEKGEVHALLGENGAGKSTLMNVLTGVHSLDSGEVYFDGEKLEHMTVRKSEEKGIAFVHQELNLFNDMTVWENIFLGKEIVNKAGCCDKRAMIRKTAELFHRLDVEIDPTEMVDHLKTSEKQLLEISKALFFKAKLLILDEPTTSLNNDEIAHLFSIIRNLKKDGTSFIFISHKMPEIFQIADRYTVMPSADMYEERPLGDPVLELRDFSGPGFEHVNLSVRRGQILGLTGLQGSGSSELLQCMFGVTASTGGYMEVDGRKIPPASIHKAMQAGVAMLPSNRKENSVIGGMSLLENMYLAEQTLSARKFHIHKRLEKKKFEHYRTLLNIRANDPDDSILSLSGGNQQKIFIARWLNTDSDILLFDNPTQGIDVGAKAEIYKLILQFSREGKTILINTLEIPELQKIADQCVVFYEGRIARILDHKDIDEHKVMMYSTNAGQAASVIETELANTDAQ